MSRVWSAGRCACRCALLVLLAVPTLFALQGCSRGHSRTIAVIPQTTAQEIWEAEHAGVAKALLGTGWRLHWNGPSSETEVDRQIALVQDAIGRRAGGLILAPDHPVALATVVRRAAEQGMPVVVIDATLNLPANLRIDYLLNDEQQTGQLAAERMGTLLQGHGKIALLGVTPALMGATERAQAFRRTLAARYPGIVVVDPLPGPYRPNLAERDTEQLLAAHPDLDGFFTVTVRATRGAYRALKLKQRIHAVHLVACEQDLDLIYYLRRGEIDSVIAEDTYAMGSQAARLIIERRAATGDGHGPGKVLHFAPRLVTRANVDDADIQQMLTMDWRPIQ